MAATATPPRPAPASRRRALSDAELADMLSLLKGADSTELKLTVPDAHQRSAVVGLGLDPLDAEVRLIHFYDTPDLALNKAGVVVRARRTARKGDDTVVKLRPVRPDNVPDHLRELPNFVIEVDAMPGGYVCSGSLKGVPKKATVRDCAAGNEPLRRLFNKQQRQFYEEHAPAGLALDDLTLLGPVFVLKLKGS